MKLFSRHFSVHKTSTSKEHFDVYLVKTFLGFKYSRINIWACGTPDEVASVIVGDRAEW
jgi:hypothetical protein